MWREGNYLDLGRELKMKVTIVPIVTGNFGVVTKILLKGLENLEVGGWVKNIPNYSIIENG